jgi:hypothetical protein
MSTNDKEWAKGICKKFDAKDARIEALEQALRPFAAAADHLAKCRDDRPLWAALDAGFAQRGQMPLTVGDVRRAAEALPIPAAKPEGE